MLLTFLITKGGNFGNYLKEKAHQAFLNLRKFINPSNQSIILTLSLIHISEPTRPYQISYAVFCLKKNVLKYLHSSLGSNSKALFSSLKEKAHQAFLNFRKFINPSNQGIILKNVAQSLSKYILSHPNFKIYIIKFKNEIEMRWEMSGKS